MTDSKNNIKVVKEAMGKATAPGTMKGLRSNDVSTIMESMRGQIEMALPKHMSVDRVIQQAVTLVVANEDIAKCTVQSILGAVMQASLLGFPMVHALGYCYFYPRKNKNKGEECQFHIGYKGYLELGNRSGKVKMIYADVVRKGEEFRYERGLNLTLSHIPDDECEGNEITHAYAVVHYMNGGYNYVVLSKKKIEELRKRSITQKNGIAGPWKTDYDKMAMAKAIRQLATYIPMSDELRAAIQADEGVITEEAFSNDHSGIRIDKVTYSEEELEEIPDAEEMKSNN